MNIIKMHFLSGKDSEKIEENCAPLDRDWMQSGLTK